MEEPKVEIKETKGDQTQRYYNHYNKLNDNIQNIFVFNRYDKGQKPRCEKFKCITYQDIAEKVIKPIIDKKDANKLTKKILEAYDIVFLFLKEVLNLMVEHSLKIEEYFHSNHCILVKPLSPLQIRKLTM